MSVGIHIEEHIYEEALESDGQREDNGGQDDQGNQLFPSLNSKKIFFKSHLLSSNEL